MNKLLFLESTEIFFCKCWNNNSCITEASWTINSKVSEGDSGLLSVLLFLFPV